MIRVWSFYAAETGLFTNRRLRCSPGAVAQNTPAGLVAIEGDYDPGLWCVNLETGELQAWQPPPPEDDEFRTWVWDAQAGWQEVPTEAAIARDARAKRDLLLSACDWVVTRATELDEAVPEDWLAYRQALRDVTEQPGFPDSIDWPAPPG